MKKLTTICLVWIMCWSASAQLIVQEFGKLPVRVTNNAVCEGFIDGVPYLFSFGGCDSTKTYKGVHKKCYRVNLETGEVLKLPNLPSGDGRMGAAATRIGDIIYVSGGYHLYANEEEFSSAKMHRYDIKANQFLSDAPDLPLPVADHVQVAWKDKLIYIVSGWRDVENIVDVQVYDVEKNTWAKGSPIWNTSSFKAFGAAGVLVEDTIFYFGGAASTTQFPARYQVRRGVINPNDPLDVKWSRTSPNNKITGFRTVGAYVNDQLHWVGGSEVSYTLTGETYTSSAKAVPTNRMLTLGPDSMWEEQKLTEIPMDLRGMAHVSARIKYIAGGMLADAEVTNKIYKLEWRRWPESVEENAQIDPELSFPSPFNEKLMVQTKSKGTLSTVVLYNLQGQEITRIKTTLGLVEVNTTDLKSGIYFIRLETADGVFVNKVMKQAD